ncbi:integral membrane protein [Ophiocordyceps camponoti-floridani]|uniref:Integral membrane protein n=1 Tax=Ophiocordyceps camponoti-floridani TaxID=2030778 RepID=A0A8H4QE01_9HYPO|nr:integral membrane protein [Ophiocordyceps camponoti-floridani]
MATSSLGLGLGPSLDPLVLLRCAPLLSSTCSLLYGWDQHFFLGLLHRQENRRLIRPYFASFFRRGLPFVLAALAVTSAGGIANLFVRCPSSSRPWYGAGLVLAAAHLLYVPLIAPVCQGLLLPEGRDGDGNDASLELRRWLCVNAWRTLTVDLGACIAFIVATTTSLRG